ncbi:PspC protein [Enterococcus phoeniculicola]|uniref:PspC protein n=1 Tax=Enterococcus phoeniculicola ATCC BAA-412 TaxID=1158610 RepID=R3TL19_9ENTE|nr:PspC domain-containing protein [Enterococcus phoeniculicola]EOL42149.1 PspC protein [Enterococcus phoeniculicola ATCC BAA-412]EOT79572.1 PspC protein [Enterococcus phoeniculicola ATCC BAA-412]OJG70311.1 PspC protein [Enterococcus phoeniculicola]
MKKKLTKSNRNVVLTGTLAGIAEYLGIDPTIIRVIYVALSMFLIGSPIILYIIMALIIPSGRKQAQSYGHENPYYQSNNYRDTTNAPRKQADKIDEDDWSDF